MKCSMVNEGAGGNITKSAERGGGGAAGPRLSARTAESHYTNTGSWEEDLLFKVTGSNQTCR